MFRSVLAVLAGYLAMAFCVIVVNLLIALAIGMPFTEEPPEVPIGLCVLNLAIAGPCGYLGGLVTASIARRSKLTHAQVLAGITLVLGIGMAVRSPSYGGPAWYLYGLPVIGALGVIIAGWQFSRPKA